MKTLPEPDGVSTPDCGKLGGVELMDRVTPVALIPRARLESRGPDFVIRIRLPSRHSPAQISQRAADGFEEGDFL